MLQNPLKFSPCGFFDLGYYFLRDVSLIFHCIYLKMIKNFSNFTVFWISEHTNFSIDPNLPNPQFRGKAIIFINITLIINLKRHTHKKVIK